MVYDNEDELYGGIGFSHRQTIWTNSQISETVAYSLSSDIQEAGYGISEMNDFFCVCLNSSLIKGYE